MSRLIWQFELTNQIWLPEGEWRKDEYKWEKRFFWPIETIIPINLAETQLNWQDAVCKTHDDEYLIHPDAPLNIKKRQNKIVYKPKHTIQNNKIAYEKKCSLMPEDEKLINTIPVAIQKSALQLVLHRKPKCMLELSKVHIKNQAFSSLCIESRSPDLIDNLIQHLQLSGFCGDYTDWLCKQDVF